MPKFIKKLSLTSKLAIFSTLIFATAILVEHIYIIKYINLSYQDLETKKLERIAKLISKNDTIIFNIKAKNQQSKHYIQQFAENIRKIAEFDFVVFMNMQGLRYSHPNKEEIGLPVYGGDEKDVLQGKSYSSYAIGTLGTSIRYFMPIFDKDHHQIGALLVGITINRLEFLVNILHKPIFFGLAVALSLCIILSIFLAKSIKKVIFGLEPQQIATALQEKNTILESIKEGIIAVNARGKITLINNQAYKILHLNPQYILQENVNINNLISNTKLLNVLRTGMPEYDEEQRIGKSTILTNRVPLVVNNQIIGAIATFRDMTEIKQLAENITGINKYVDALRSQSHEFHNQLHIIYGLMFNDKKEEILNYLEQIIGNKNFEKSVVKKNIKDAILSAFLASKYSRARELGIDLMFHVNTEIQDIRNDDISKKLVSIIGNLIDNAIDAIQLQEIKKINIFIDVEDEILEIKVYDNGPGIDKTVLEQIFYKGISTKGKNRGYGLYLVINILNQLNGEISIDSNQTGTCFAVQIPIESIYV